MAALAVDVARIRQQRANHLAFGQRDARMGVGVERVGLTLAVGEPLVQVVQVDGYGLLKVVQMHGRHHAAGQKCGIVGGSIAQGEHG